MTNLKTGLLDDEIYERKKAGKINGETNLPTKSIGQIIRTNTLTFFNFINIVLLVLIIMVGEYKNGLFIGIIVFNTAIGIFQEIRAKCIIDKLTLISAPKAQVVRNGVSYEIPVCEIVLDDLCVLTSGMQVCSDSIVLEGECEVNESLITGESDPVSKKTGDSLLSGSFIICGKVKAQVEHVGADNFATKITSGAKYLKKVNSEMLNALNKILKIISVIIIPIALILFVKTFWGEGLTFSQSVVSTVAAVIGMIPEGLMLLTSMVLAVSVIRLSKHKTLVQELYCIETLARVDTLCLDKTGTITEGTMQVDELIPLEGNTNCNEIMTALSAVLTDNNPTFNAIKEKWYGKTNFVSTKIVPFSSAKKWSGAEFEGRGAYIIGAAEFILSVVTDQILEKINIYSKTGHRVLLLAWGAGGFNGNNLPEKVKPLAIIVISDKIRKEAPATLEYFANQGVAIKIISGDNPVTVSSIAKKAGLADADNYIDASTVENIGEICDDYSVFGRVTPEQKLELVKALKAKNHTVGMTGDGVNDVLALKEADCSIAMQSGSDAAKNVSNLILLDSNFASMPKVVAEGRRSINNIERSASLFLTKTVYASVLAVIFVFMAMSYPFEPIQLTLVNAFAIGIPSFLLSLEPNFNIIKGSFIKNVIRKVIPYGVIITLNVMATMLISHFANFNLEEIATLATAVLAISSFAVLIKVCIPFDIKKIILIIFVLLLFIVAFFGFDWFFGFSALTSVMIYTIIGSAVLSAGLLIWLTKLSDFIFDKMEKK